MLRLILVRHAKSAWDEPSLSDFDRPLAPRGRKSAKWIGETIRNEGWLPDAILCSTAARTRETLELAGLAGPKTIYDDAFYALRDADYVELIRTDGQGRVLMLVGHNMAISDTAARLLDTVAIGDFATGAIAVIDFDARSWPDIAEATGRLVDFRKPPK